MVEHFMQDIDVQHVQNYQQMCVSTDHTDGEQLREDEDVESDKAGEVLKVHLKKLSNLLKKISKNKSVRNIGRAIISEAPGAFEALSKKVKNKKIKAILNSDIAKTGVDLATGFALDKIQLIFKWQVF